MTSRVRCRLADAVTPWPMFQQTPEQMRAEAGPELIRSGGIPATVFGPGATDGQFVDGVKRRLGRRGSGSY